MEQEKKNTVKRTVADIQDRQKRGGVIGKGDTSNDIDVNKILTSEGLEMARAFGHDPKEIAKYKINRSKRSDS